MVLVLEGKELVLMTEIQMQPQVYSLVVVVVDVVRVQQLIQEEHRRQEREVE